MARPEKFRLGEILVQQNLLSQDQLQAALDEQKKTGRKLGRVFVDKGFVTEEQISEAIARQINAPYINLKYFNIKPALVRLLPEAQARRFRALVLEQRDNAVRVGFADPTDLFAYDEVARLLKRDIDIAVVTESQLLEAVDRVYQRTEEISGLAKELTAELGEGAVDLGALALTPGLEEAPVVKLLQSVFEAATQVRASDIHIEPQERSLVIRFRIDGVMHNVYQVPPGVMNAMIARVKLLGRMDVVEKRRPLDGRIKTRNPAGEEVEMRLSTLPTAFGEKMVMRIFDPQTAVKSIEQLGMGEPEAQRWQELIGRPHGA